MCNSNIVINGTKQTNKRKIKTQSVRTTTIFVYYTCTAILCLHSEAEVNSTNVLSSWHCNIDTQFHLSVSFIDTICAPLKSYHHNCKYKFNGIIFFYRSSTNPRQSCTSMLVCYCDHLILGGVGISTEIYRHKRILYSGKFLNGANFRMTIRK